jgi:amino acid transporter
MKSSITQLFKQVSSDRQFMTVLVILGLVGVLFSIYVAISLRPSDLQVVTHYTAFGSTNFYRDKWYYLIGFVIFGIVSACLHAALACKIYRYKGRELAIPFAWLGVIVIILATATMYQVLKVAALS